MSDSNDVPVAVLQDYALDGCVLGAGAFAKIIRATSRKTGEKVALKVMKRSSYRKRCLEYQIDVELELTQLCSSHPNVISVYDVFDNGELVVMCMPCASIDLQRATQNLKKSTGKELECWGEPTSLFLFQQLVDAVRFIHENGVIHRDLKPENLLLTEKQQLLVGDFGWSTRMSQNVGRALAGTYVYMAPEILDGRKHSAKADIWGCGMILYFILFGHPLLDQSIIGPGVTQMTATDPVRSAQLRARLVRERIDKECPLKVDSKPTFLSWEVWLMLRDLVSVVPRIRPDANTLLQNELFKDTSRKIPKSYQGG